MSYKNGACANGPRGFQERRHLSRGSTSRLKRLTVAVSGIGIGEEKILKPLNCGAAWTLTSLALVGDGFKSAEDANDAVAFFFLFEPESN